MTVYTNLPPLRLDKVLDPSTEFQKWLKGVLVLTTLAKMKPLVNPQLGSLTMRDTIGPAVSPTLTSEVTRHPRLSVTERV